MVSKSVKTNTSNCYKDRASGGSSAPRRPPLSAFQQNSLSEPRFPFTARLSLLGGEKISDQIKDGRECPLSFSVTP